MASRPYAFASGEIYHCYNRGVDKRVIFHDQQDYIYFLKMLRYFNTSRVLGKLRLLELHEPTDPPVTILSYCILPNHYHLLLRCNDIEGGLSKYMQRIGGGYTMYFNQKYERSGSLFQGKFKAKLVKSDLDLKHLLAYVTYNNIVHDIYDKKIYRSSLNMQDDLVRGLSSNYGEENMREVVDIIKEMRSSRKDLEL
ncbi:MAG: transposase [Candidatus Paceibacteria bacterium]